MRTTTTLTRPEVTTTRKVTPPVPVSPVCDLSDEQINAIWDESAGDMRAFVQSVLERGISIGSGIHSRG
ncbi:hypothetical protein LG293_17710 (plasmid) [Citricoccus nitrophenolicus]